MTPNPDRSISETTARVLAVDDEAHIRHAIVRALRLNHYAADEAGSGRRALELLGQSPYDILLLDMRMPGMDGIEVMHRARAIQPELLIIVLTGHATLDSAIAAVKLGAVDYLLKPASLHDIAAAVAAALQARQQQVQRQQLMNAVSAAVDVLRHTQLPTAQPMAAPHPTDEPWPDRFLHVGPLTLDHHRAVTNRPARIDRRRSADSGRANGAARRSLDLPPAGARCLGLRYARG